MPHALGFPNLIATVGHTLSGGSWSASAPLSRLATWPLAESARSANALAASTQLEVTWGATTPAARLLAVMGHNLSQTATVRWVRRATPGGAIVADSGAVPAWAFAPREHDGRAHCVMVTQAQAVAAGHETVEIVDTGNPAGYVEIGRICICPITIPTYGPAYGLRDGVTDLSTVTKAESGADWPTTRRRQRSVTFTIPWLSLAEGDTLHELEQVEGTTAEIAWLPDFGDSERMQRYGFVGRLRELSGLEYPSWRLRSKAFAIEQRM
ncbi:hypothetical protein [Candidatus Accumulibacter vicinus]|jgi:hypothetical protein|uniref:Uncharacterized protein n=1 Tax=Candidatus Accumulibacter vicinus TaxID=2954382 RepID=A0A084XUR2_9PROT|nr:hypothetical protein [Candidatus Accumulibacter vicinus]KFB66206.1 MAG: hypothetical protein CAPSK01_004575 [Candidatus Accumulibacter vicinus]RTL25189.1 MAG: hypothetical protein EKK55_09890 [Rhodocyclaceae bacterium]